MPPTPLHLAAGQELRHAEFYIATAEEIGRVEVGGAVYNAISEQYRKVGVSYLLLDGNLDDYAHSLISSALTRRELLRRPEPLEPDHARRASFLAPALDAVAVAQFGLAAEIGRLSPSVWYEGLEYEEDFLYARFLFGLLSGHTLDLEDVLDRHEAALRGVHDPRNAVGRALYLRDPVAFVEAFDEFVRVTADEIAEARVSAYAFYDFQEVSVEGIALLQLADRLGLPTEREYRHCPSWARRTDYAPYVPESFPNVALDG